MNTRWCTKEDVLKDIAKATGAKLDMDSSFFVVGEKPPPVPLSDTDHDLELMFGDAIDKNPHEHDTKPMNVAMTPDLKGITQMIRMVENFDDSSSSECDSKVCTTRPKASYDIIKISKLNPHVKEFQPGKNLSSPLVSSSEQTNYLDANLVDIGQIDPQQNSGISSNTKAVNSKLDVNCNNVSKNDVNGQNIKSTEVSNIEADLKNKITHTNNGKVSNFHVKKERNFAIANLQKQLAMQHNNESADNEVKESSKVVKLITPDFYEQSKAISEEAEKPNENQKVNKTCEPPTIHSSPSSQPSSSYKIIKKLMKNEANPLGTVSDPGVCNNSISHKKVESPAQTALSETKISMDFKTKEAELNVDLSDPQIRDSIDKVNNWLNKNDDKSVKMSPSPVRNEPALLQPGGASFLNSFTFKRKETRKSPNVTEKKISKPTQDTIEQYKPSEYAQELSKIYKERIKKKEMPKTQCNWENLAKILKEKEEKMKQERLTQQNDAADSKGH